MAVVHNVGYPKAIGAVSVINHYFGRDEITLGAFKGTFGEKINGRVLDHLMGEYYLTAVKVSMWTIWWRASRLRSNITPKWRRLSWS